MKENQIEKANEIIVNYDEKTTTKTGALFLAGMNSVSLTDIKTENDARLYISTMQKVQGKLNFKVCRVLRDMYEKNWYDSKKGFYASVKNCGFENVPKSSFWFMFKVGFLVDENGVNSIFKNIPTGYNKQGDPIYLQNDFTYTQLQAVTGLAQTQKDGEKTKFPDVETIIDLYKNDVFTANMTAKQIANCLKKVEETETETATKTATETATETKTKTATETATKAPKATKAPESNEDNYLCIDEIDYILNILGNIVPEEDNESIYNSIVEKFHRAYNSIVTKVSK